VADISIAAWALGRREGGRIEPEVGVRVRYTGTPDLIGSHLVQVGENLVRTRDVGCEGQARLESGDSAEGPASED